MTSSATSRHCKFAACSSKPLARNVCRLHNRQRQEKNTKPRRLGAFHSSIFAACEACIKNTFLEFFEETERDEEARKPCESLGSAMASCTNLTRGSVGHPARSSTLADRQRCNLPKVSISGGGGFGL